MHALIRFLYVMVKNCATKSWRETLDPGNLWAWWSRKVCLHTELNKLENILRDHLTYMDNINENALHTSEPSRDKPCHEHWHTQGAWIRDTVDWQCLHWVCSLLWTLYASLLWIYQIINWITWTCDTLWVMVHTGTYLIHIPFHSLIHFAVIPSRPTQN